MRFPVKVGVNYTGCLKKSLRWIKVISTKVCHFTDEHFCATLIYTFRRDIHAFFKTN